MIAKANLTKDGRSVTGRYLTDCPRRTPECRRRSSIAPTVGLSVNDMQGALFYSEGGFLYGFT
jgi:hypothetical protein